MNVISVSDLDPDTRTTVCELILCDPNAGRLAREFLVSFTPRRGSTQDAALELIGWLILAREACGVEGVGHA
jgi:hypothetical protein